MCVQYGVRAVLNRDTSHTRTGERSGKTELIALYESMGSIAPRPPGTGAFPTRDRLWPENRGARGQARRARPGFAHGQEHKANNESFMSHPSINFEPPRASPLTRDSLGPKPHRVRIKRRHVVDRLPWPAGQRKRGPKRPPKVSVRCACNTV